MVSVHDESASPSFDRIGSDERTKDKYFKMMLKYGYLRITQDSMGKQELFYTVSENIENMSPQSLGDYLKELKAKANNEPIPKQTTLETQA